MNFKGWLRGSVNPEWCMSYELEMGCRGGVGGGASGRGGAAEGGVNVVAGVRPGPEPDDCCY